MVKSHWWLGGVKTSLVKLEKGPGFLLQSIRAFELLSDGQGDDQFPDQTLLEVQFENETGFGRGVTQSFYTEIASALLLLV